MKQTKVFFVRHAETEWNKQRKVQGSGSNPRLSEFGFKQLIWLSNRFNGENIAAVYSSDLQRAILTAQAIASSHRLEVKLEKSLREIDAGDFEGRTVDKIGHISQYLIPDLKSRLLPRLPQGESLHDVQTRAWPVVRQLVKNHLGNQIVIVSHYFTILTIIGAVLELPLGHIRYLRMDTASISTVDFGPEIIRLVGFNERWNGQ
jgi:broad specificity phosphatase PhoE